MDLNFDKLDFNRNSTYKKLEYISNNITTERGISQAYNILISRIIANKQEFLIKILKKMDEIERNDFILHLETIDFELLDSLYHNLCSRRNENCDCSII